MSPIDAMSTIQQHTSPTPPTRLPRWIPGAIVLWLLMVGIGWCWMTSYATRAEADSPEKLVRRVSADRQSTPRQLLMFVHPHCPCSVASLTELGRILEHAPASLEKVIYLYRPFNQPDSWVEGRISRIASSIPGLTVRIDVDGQLARERQATTSGSVQVLDAEGRCLFTGGITSARGHEGDNLGESSIVHLLRGETATVQATPVFGCRLQSGAQQ